MHPTARRSPIGLLALFTILAIAFLYQLTDPSRVPAADAGGGNFVFILDASGSMGARIQGRIKMDVAKEALSGLVKDLPAGVNVGLVAYGHRQKGDCSDVEELSPLGPPDKEGLIGIIQGIAPKGMTPITFSVRKVAEGLKGTPGETTIILVSDGEETCKGDPCALVRELRASGIKFVLHVIGFDVNEKEKAQLVCMANAGGGLYYSAKNAGELKTAAQRAVEKKEPPPGSLSLRAVSYGKPLKAYFTIYKATSEAADKREKAAEGWMENGSAVHALKAGMYDVVVENRADAGKVAVTFQGVEIEPGKEVEKVADFSGGLLVVKALRNGKPCRAYCGIYKSGADGEKGGEKVNEGWAGEEGFKLAPGSYDIVVENREDSNKPSVSFEAVKIEAGKPLEKIAEFSGGNLNVKALRNGNPFKAFCIVYKAQGDEEQEREKVAEGWTEPEGTVFKLTTGAYDLIVENQEDVDRPTMSFQSIPVEAEQTVEKVADFSGGTLKVTAKRNGQLFSAYCTIFRAEGGTGKAGEKVYAAWTRVEGVAVRLQPGVYDIVVENQEDTGRPRLSFPGIKIEAGKTIEQLAEFAGGTLKVKAMRNGKALNAYCIVFPGGEGKDRKPVTNANTRGDAGATFQLMPGVYDLVVENHDDAGKPTLRFPGITIESGKTVEQTAEFSGGTLKVKAMRNGKAFSAYCIVFPGGEGKDRKPVTNGNTRGDAGAAFHLMPGVYDLVVENHEDAGKPTLRFPGITIESGKTVEQTVEFTGGTLKVKAMRNGKAFNAYCIVFPGGEGKDRKPVTNGNTRGDAGATFQLMPGVYDLVVENHEDAGKPSLSFPGITIESGKTVEQTAEFTGGTLVVKAARNGKAVNAYCIVFPGGEGKDRKPVTNGNTRDASGVTFKLPPGTYDVVIEDKGAREKKEIKGTIVAPRAVQTVDVSF